GTGSAGRVWHWLRRTCVALAPPEVCGTGSAGRVWHWPRRTWVALAPPVLTSRARPSQLKTRAEPVPHHAASAHLAGQPLPAEDTGGASATPAAAGERVGGRGAGLSWLCATNGS
ncbi:MAG: hypothetical protein AB7O38_07920, partial [Pirellulaceae bacterium]